MITLPPKPTFAELLAIDDMNALGRANKLMAIYELRERFLPTIARLVAGDLTEQEAVEFAVLADRYQRALQAAGYIDPELNYLADDFKPGEAA